MISQRSHSGVFQAAAMITRLPHRLARSVLVSFVLALLVSACQASPPDSVAVSTLTTEATVTPIATTPPLVVPTVTPTADPTEMVPVPVVTPDVIPTDPAVPAVVPSPPVASVEDPAVLPTEVVPSERPAGTPVAPGSGDRGSERGGEAKGARDLSAAAAALGVTVAEIEAALGGPPPDIEAAAATLGITVAELQALLPARPDR